MLELKIVDVTREVGSSPATFYQYFVDVDAAILALADEATEQSARSSIHLERRPGRPGRACTAPASSSTPTLSSGTTTTPCCGSAT